MAKVLVVGGAGYVGSSTCAWLIDAGHDVWVLDDLSTGHREFLLGRGFTQARAGDFDTVFSLVKAEGFDCVMHFAARSLVAESVEKPLEYFENNVTQTERLLEAMLAAGTRNFIFSSTCAIFGDPGDQTLCETSPKNPINPYGESKLEAEKKIEALCRKKGLRAIALRYFNAAGAESGLRVGELHDPETHLIPRILKAAMASHPVDIFGTDYPTPDGTCVRDYIHVTDLAAAHGASMERLLALPQDGAGENENSGLFECYNLGSEKGFSVRDVIAATEKVIGRPIAVLEKNRRPGDPARLVAESHKARQTFGFGEKRIGLEEIIRSAWNWEKGPKRNRRKKAVFLDRDGTLNEDPGYLNHPSQVHLLPFVGEALAMLKNAGFLLVVISNQSGVGRGLIKKESLPAIHQQLDELLKPWDVAINHYELCFHRPDENCDCRKPKPKLLIDAAKALGIDISQSFMVGDKLSDLDAGKAAGCRGVVLVTTGDGLNSLAQLKSGQEDFVGHSLVQVVQWILSQSQ